jgi:integrase
LTRDVLLPLSSQFPKLAGAAMGFADGRLHSFRHSFCSVCADAGVPEQTLMAWLGHRDSNMVKRYYHLLDDSSKQAMQRVQFHRKQRGK